MLESYYFDFVRTNAFTRHMQRKQIDHIKLTLTTRCSSSCAYCFVNKTNERMTVEVAEKGVDLILSSPGRKKVIELFGGEPFLEFGLIKKITDYAQKIAGRDGKDLTVSVCTNLTALSEEQITFIRDHELKITVSLVGKKEHHDKFRFFANGEGTYNRVIQNLKVLSANISSANLGISFVVPASLSHLLFDNFRHIINLGVSRNINLEIVENFEKWGRDEQVNFIHNLKMLIAEVCKSINSNDPIFLNPINWEIARNHISRRQTTHCPLNEPLEIYPSGDMAFSPFVLNRPDKEKYIVGNVLTHFKDPYRFCFFDRNDEMCLGCREGYFGPTRHADTAGLVREFYSLTCLKVAREIIKNNPAYARYCSQHLCF